MTSTNKLKWNKFLSLHELNEEESNDKVYIKVYMKTLWKI